MVDLPAVPHNIEAEAALLGAMLIENHILDMAADILAPDDFFEPIHSRIFFHAASERMKGKSVTPITLKGYFDDEGDAIKEIGGPAYLFRLTADGVGLLDPRGLIDQILDLSRRRKMMGGLLAAYRDCVDPDKAIAEIASGAEAALCPEVDKTIEEGDAGFFSDAFIADYDQPDHGVVCKAIPSLDQLLGKLKPKSLNIIAGRPGMGKTALAVSYALGAAHAGHGCLFISVEMSGKELAGRMLSDLCFDPPVSVPYHVIRDGTLNMNDRLSVDAARADLAKMPLRVVDTSSIPISRLATIVRRNARRFEARGQKLELVIVDYLQLLNSDNRKAPKYEAISDVSMGLKALAKSSNVAIIALAQLSREVEKRPDKRPQLADLRDSGQIEQDADSVLFLLRPEYYLKQDEPDRSDPKRLKWEEALDETKGRIEFILAKRRNGTTGTAIGEFHATFQAVR